MADVTKLLEAIEKGEPQAAEELLPLVYDELRKLARVKLRHEQPGQTLQATALVHEAYLRLVAGQGSGVRSRESEANAPGPNNSSPTPDSRPPTPAFDSRGHF